MVGVDMKALNSVKTFAVIGGDKRQLFLADSLTKDGYGVILGGFDNIVSVGAITLSDISTAVSYGDKLCSYDDLYRRWIGSVCRGFESLRRNLLVQQLQEQKQLKLVYVFIHPDRKEPIFL